MFACTGSPREAGCERQPQRTACHGFRFKRKLAIWLFACLPLSLYGPIVSSGHKCASAWGCARGSRVRTWRVVASERVVELEIDEGHQRLVELEKEKHHAVVHLVKRARVPNQSQMLSSNPNPKR
eukprot:2224495-Pleurochrysis_carterae.AAC.2